MKALTLKKKKSDSILKANGNLSKHLGDLINADRKHLRKIPKVGLNCPDLAMYLKQFHLVCLSSYVHRSTLFFTFIQRGNSGLYWSRNLKMHHQWHSYHSQGERKTQVCVGGWGGVFYETDNQKNHGPRKKPTLKLKKYDCLVFHRCLFFQSNLCFPPLCLTI